MILFKPVTSSVLQKDGTYKTTEAKDTPMAISESLVVIVYDVEKDIFVVSLTSSFIVYTTKTIETWNPKEQLSKALKKIGKVPQKTVSKKVVKKKAKKSRK